MRRQLRELSPLGLLVKRRLIDLNITQAELAEAVGMKQGHLADMLRGERAGHKYREAMARKLKLTQEEMARLTLEEKEAEWVRRKVSPYGIWLKTQLMQLGMTQRELAQALQVGDEYLSAMVRGRVSGSKYREQIQTVLEERRQQVARRSA